MPRRVFRDTNSLSKHWDDEKIELPRVELLIKVCPLDLLSEQNGK